MLFGITAGGDTPGAATQGNCPPGFVYDSTAGGWLSTAFPCIPVETSAPSGIVETNPALLPALSKLTGKMIAAVAIIGAVIGVGVYKFKRKP